VGEVCNLAPDQLRQRKNQLKEKGAQDLLKL